MSEDMADYGVSYIASAPEEFKVGDRVKFKTEGEIKTMLEPSFWWGISIFADKEAMIVSIDDCGTYRIDIDPSLGGIRREFILAKFPDTIRFNEKPLEKQVGGNHYKLPIQPVEFIERNGLGFCVGNCIKYLCRYKNKNGREDLEKAKHYIDLLIQMEYPEQ